MGEDTDFVAAFSAVGRAVSGDGSVGSALNDAYTAVLARATPMIPLRNPPTTRRRPGHHRAEEEDAACGGFPAPRPVTSAANTPAQVCLLQQQLGFAYAAPVAGEVTSASAWCTHPLDGEERFHYGLDIGAGRGASSRASPPGQSRPSAAAPTSQYVMVAHANAAILALCPPAAA